MGAASRNPVSWLAGFIPDLPTPFDEAGAIDLKAFARLCERQIAAGVPAIVVSETAGEASTGLIRSRKASPISNSFAGPARNCVPPF
jgi:hypothetical protein